MKYKLGLITLLMTFLAFGVASTAFAAASALTTTATAGADLGRNVTPGDSVHVVQSFTITASNGAGDTGNTISTIILDGSVGAAPKMVNTEITRVAIYEDVNGNGSFDFNDVLVMQTTAAGDITSFVDGSTLTFDIADITLAAGASRNYLAVISVSTTVDDTHLIDCSVNTTNTGGAANNSLAGGVDDPVEVVATHLQFKTTGYNSMVAAGGEILKTGELLWAVDDYGNLDTDYVGDVQFKAETYTTGTDVTANLTATYGAGATDVKTTTANFATFAGGKLSGNLVAGAGTMTSIVFAAASPGPVTLVAVARNDAASKSLEGSITISNEAYQAVIGVQSSRGIEVYDVDHDGHIDHMTIFFNAPVDVNTTTNAAFTVSGYTLAGAPVSNFDAGGVGIRNAGEYGVTLTLVEKAAFDTNAKPDVTYTASAGAIDDRTAAGLGGTPAPSIVSASAIEVDKARPVLLTSTTMDANDNGKVDGIKLSFSEPVYNVLASTLAYGAGDDIGNFAVALQNTMQGGVANSISFTGDVTALPSQDVTLTVNETIPNTGVLPIILHKQGNATYSIRDNATAATGAGAPNLFVSSFTNYVATSVGFNVNDGVSPIITNVTTGDNDSDGRIDRLTVTFSEPMNNALTHLYTGITGYTETAAFGSQDAAAGTYLATAGSLNAQKDAVTYTITESNTVYDTEVKPTIHYNPVVGNLRDANGFELAAYGPGGRTVDAAVLIDGAAPVIVSAVSVDAKTDTDEDGAGGGNAAAIFESATPNGRLDGVRFVFSEQVKSAAAAQPSAATLTAAIDQFTITHEDAGAGSAPGPVTKLTAEQTGANHYDSAVVPTWVSETNGGDSKTTLTVYFREVDFALLDNNAAEASRNKGDTGVLLGLAYAADGTNNIKDLNDVNLAAAPANATDGAAPMIVNGLRMNGAASLYGPNAFANIKTVDRNAKNAGSNNFNNGDGFIDGFVVNFSENIHISDPDTATVNAAFTVSASNGNTITINAIDVDGDWDSDAADAAAGIVAAGVNTLNLIGASNMAGTWDTGVTPTITFNGGVVLYDGTDAAYNVGTDNIFAQAGAQPSYDTAKPVYVQAVGGVDTDEIKVTWSEPVWPNAQAVDGLNLAADYTGVNSTTVFGYNDANAAGNTALKAATEITYASNIMTLKTNAALTLSDVLTDSLWVIANNLIVDDADAIHDGAGADNQALGNADKAGYTVTIDDPVAPWITSATTVDADGDGKVDHIRFTFSEPIKVASIGTVNAMSADVSASWVISGYTGTAKFNLFQNNDAGKAAAITAGKPVFSDNIFSDGKTAYLELEEDKVPASVTGLGTTDFRPTMTFTAGVLTDNKPNTMETTTAHFSGQVQDTVGPVVMKAEYTTTQTLKATFSEDVVAGALNRNFINWTMSNAGVNYQNNIVDITEPTPGVLVYRTTDVFSWEGDMAGTLATVNVGGGLSSITDADLDGTGADAATAGIASGADAYANATWYAYNSSNAIVAAAAAGESVPANVAITISIPGVTPEAGSGVTAAALKPVTAALPAINNKNVTAVKFYGTGVAGDTVTVKLVDVAGSEVTTDVVVNSASNFEGAIDASALANGMVTVKAGKAVAGAVAAWFTGGQFLKDTIVIGAPADLVVTDIADDQGGFANVSFTKSDLETAGHDFYEVDYYVLQGKVGETWSFVTKFPVDGNVDATFNATNVYVGSATEFRVNAVAKAGIAKPADAPSAMSSAYAYGTGSAIDNILPGAFVDFAVDGSTGTGVALTWTAPADHGLFNAQYGIYGVDSYEVYRRLAGSEDAFVLVGTATPGSALFTDGVEDSKTVYEYMVKAVDGLQVVETSVIRGMATEGQNLDGVAGVSLGDLVLFGAQWGLNSTDANYLVNYDFNRDGKIDLADLIVLGTAWTGSAKVAKLAELPTANVALNMSSEFNAENSVNYITISTDALDINGVEISLKYDAEKYEFVSDSVTGLGELSIPVTAKDGIVNFASLYGNDQFSGTITLGFKSKVQNAEMSVEMVNALVAINGEVSLASKAGAVSVKAVPSVYALSQNFPNPFNPTTTISYSIPQAGNVSLVIYNIAGQKVRTLVNDVQAPAVYKVVWDGRNDNGSSVATGMYFYKLVSGNYSKIVKMTLMK